MPEHIRVAGARDHHGKVFDQILPQLHNNGLYGDKAYQRADIEAIRRSQNLTGFDAG
jgi:hypothetical protein